MSTGHEVAEEIEHAAHENKRIAVLIAFLALFLAFASTLGKSAQTEAISQNVEASNLWSFYQAKAIRRTMLTTAAESLGTNPPMANGSDVQKQIDAWKKNAERYASEPETKEGTKELAIRAKAAEERHENALAKYHNFEIASAALEIGIVLASATIITGIVLLAWIAGGLGAIGIMFMAVALFAPHALHVF